MPNLSMRKKLERARAIDSTGTNVTGHENSTHLRREKIGRAIAVDSPHT